MPTKTFPGELRSVPEICLFVVNFAQKAGLDDSETYCVELAVDEACTNIIEHAYREKPDGNIECSIDVVPDGISITLKDSGETFDPDSIPDLDPKTPLKKLHGGGAGLYLMRKMMDQVRFEFDPRGYNVLTMTKLRKP